MAQQTSQLGEAQLGALWLGGADVAAPPPPFDPSTVPWNVIINSGEPPIWRRQTLDSFVAYTVLPQPSVDPSTVSPPQTISDFDQRLTPPWRFRTQDSFVTVAYPAFIQAQQLNLINQGLNHRRIGNATLSGGTAGTFVFITGTDRSATFAALSCNIRRQLQTTGQCTAVFNVPSGGFTPARGANIVITENGSVLFSGLIIHRKQAIYPGTTMTRWEITGVDWNGILQRHLTALDTVASSLLTVAGQILGQPGIYADHISTAGVDTTIQVADPFSWGYIKASDALNEASLSTNTIWWVDNYKILHQILPANCPLSTAYKLVADGTKQTDPNYDRLYIEDGLDNYRNVQYVRTTNQILSAQITLTETHTFSGAVADDVAPTTYPLTTAPQSVKENGVELVGTSRFFQLMTDGTKTTYPPSGDGYYWAVGFFGIWHWPSNTVPVNGTVLAVTYTGVSTFQGNVVAYLDSAEITAQQAVSGGSGRFEEITDYSGSITYAQALDLAKGIEQATAPPPAIITCETTEAVEDIGYAVTVNLPAFGVTGTYVIQQLDRTDMGADLGKGTRFLTKLQLVSARTLGNFTQYFERLLARLSKAQIEAPTEKPSWGLAYDTPGNTSPGLKTGTMGQPLDVKTALGRILYVSAVFTTAADQNIIIDILLNGNSIFDSAKLTYTVAQTGIQVLYANFNANQVNVKQGDVLTLNILQTGTLQPGKNGTVTVVIGQR